MIGSAVCACAGWGMLVGWFTYPWWGPPASRTYDAVQFVLDRRRLRARRLAAITAGARLTDSRPTSSVEPAGLGEQILDESIEEAERLYDKSRCERGESSWTYGEVDDYVRAFDHLTVFDPAEWGAS